MSLADQLCRSTACTHTSCAYARSFTGQRTHEGFIKFIEDALAADKGFARIPSLDELAASFGSAAKPQKVLDDLTVSE